MSQFIRKFLAVATLKKAFASEIRLRAGAIVIRYGTDMSTTDGKVGLQIARVGGIEL